MIRNRSKVSRRRNFQNVRKRNSNESQEYSSSASGEIASSSNWDEDYDESGDSSDEESSSPVIRGSIVKRKLTARSKRRTPINRNHNKSNARKGTNSDRDSEAAGPSHLNLRKIKPVDSNTRSNKRKFKDGKNQPKETDNDSYSSSDTFNNLFVQSKTKRMRQVNPICSSDSGDDSTVRNVQPLFMRRQDASEIESSTSSDIIGYSRSGRISPDSESSNSDIFRLTEGVRRRNQTFGVWSDSSSDFVEDSSTRESSSPIIGVTRRAQAVHLLRSMNLSSSPTTNSNSSFSFESELFNSASIPDSESSFYNTAQSSNCNKDQNTDSDSSDTDGEKCAICLKKFRSQLIGNPSNCDHNFCAPCLKKWSESSTTCPVDRSTFDAIVIRSEINGAIVDRVKVENRNFGIFPPLDIDEVLLNESINCVICGSGDDEETLLLCDFCNLGYHMACLIPPLQAIPAGSWYCPPCMDLHSNPTENMNEAIRLLGDIPMRSYFLLPPVMRPHRLRPISPNRVRPRTGRSRPSGPLPRGRGPTTTRGIRSQNSSSGSGLQDFSNVIESMAAHMNAAFSVESRRKRRRKRGRRSGSARVQQAASSDGTQAVDSAINRIVRKVNERTSTVSRPIARPRGSNDVVELVFPSFSLFENEYEFDYFSDEGNDLDGEVAIMARVRSEYSARRVQSRKNIVSSLSGRTNLMVEVEETSSSVNLLDSILESQSLWHSRNVEIKSKKDGTLEIKKKNGENKPDLTNTNHSSKEIPLYPNKNENSSENKSYTNNNARYSSLGGSNNGGGNTFTPSTSSFNSLNPSTRPGFSNLVGNSSTALDLSPFRGAAPIRFRMNPPRPAMKRPIYNSNSQRQSSMSTSITNSMQSPKKSSNDDDVDLYDDIDTENMESEKTQEMFASLEPPPEPPALLIGSDSSSDDENNGLVIDDKALNAANRSNMYDPTDPNEDSDDGNDKNSMVPGYLKSPSYGGLSEFGPHLPLPEPPALPIELDSVKDSDEDEEAECPNMTLYSSTSINLANNVQDIPIPDAAYPTVTHDDLDFIPVPTSGSQDASDKTETCDENVYSPTNSETSSVGCVQVYPKNSTSADEEAFSDDDSEKRERRGSKRKSRRDSLDAKNAEKMSKSEDVYDEKSKEIDLTEIDDSNDSKGEKSGSEDDSEGFSDEASIKEVDDDRDEEQNVDKVVDEEVIKADDNCRLAEDRSDSDEEEKSDEKDEENALTAEVEDKESSEKDESIVAVAEMEGAAQDDEGGKANAADVIVSNYLLPSEDLDPVSDVEYNDFPDYQRSSTSKDKRKKRKRVRKRDSSSDNKMESKELEEGEIEDEKSRRKYASQRRKTRSESPEHSVERKSKRKRDRKEKSAGKENKGSYAKSGEDFTWKKLSKNTKERNYRDGKTKPGDKLAERNKEREAKNKKEKRKEIERYDVRKIVSDKPRPVRDEFGRDVSANRSRSRTRSRSESYSGRRRSKGGTTTFQRSLSQDDRWIDWSPVWTQRRSRSRTRRSKSRSRNRSRLSSDRYRNRSKNRDREREYDKRELRKRRRSISSEVEKYSPPPPTEIKKRRRSRDRSRKSESYGPLRPGREIPDYYYDRSWSRSITYASLTPEPDPYVRYSRSPSILEASTRIPLLSPDRDHDLLTPNPQNLTVIVPNVDVNKKKHKKKKDGKKKKKKQPSKEVFTSGDNIVVSVNFDDNQKIISAKSSKRKHAAAAAAATDEKTRKKKKDDTRKKRKQTLQVSEEVLNAKPVAVIDLNSSPCKEMSPTEVISLTDSGDENNANENANPVDRRISQEYAENYPPNEDKSKSPERRAYVMTQSGPKTPPEPPIKFTVTSTVPMRTLPTNPIFEQDEIDQEVDVRYSKGPDTPSEAANQTRRSISPNTTMYDPFEPTKSRSQSPDHAEIYEERKEQPTPEERRPVLDMFAEDNDKPSDGQSAEKAEPQEESKENTTPNVPAAAEEPQANTAFGKTSPTKEANSAEPSNETSQSSNSVNKLVLDLSSLGDDFVPKSSIPLVKTSQGKYEFQSGKAPDKPITVVISQQSQPVKPQPQQVMVTPTRQVLAKPVEPIKQPVFPDVLPWKLPPPVSQPTFSTPPAASAPPSNLVAPSKSATGVLTQNGNQDESAFEVDDSPYSPASSEGDDLFEPPPLNSTSSPNKQKPSPMPAVNSYKSRVDALFSSSPIKKLPPRMSHGSKPVSAIKGTKKFVKSNVAGSKKEVGIKADEEQLKILDDVPNSAVEMIVKEKFLKKLHRQERVVEEVKVVLKPHYAKKHINKEEYKDILRKAVPKICHNKSGDINPSKIQSLVEAYVKKIRHSKKKLPAMFPPMQSGTKIKKPKTLWG